MVEVLDIGVKGWASDVGDGIYEPGVEQQVSATEFTIGVADVVGRVASEDHR